MSLKHILAASAATLAVLVATSAFAATVTQPLNVREEPDNEAEVLGVLAEGTEVECTDMVGGWCELLGGEGYVYAAYLDFDGGGDDDEDDADSDEEDDGEDSDDSGDDVDVDVEVDLGGVEVEVEL